MKKNTPNLERPTWLKNRGYLHITSQINVDSNTRQLIAKLTNPNYIAKYAFFPLMYASIDERRYKIHPEVVSFKPEKIRCHSYRDANGKYQKHIKTRPLHYATHRDALVFGYYAHLLQEKYEALLAKNPSFSACILAYRKIRITDDLNSKHKSTIHFAHEVFSEIKQRSDANDCMVLAFDIKSFFSGLNHQKLKKAWSELLEEPFLPDDHYNVFKASTRFSYILLDDLRIYKKGSGRKAGFDEQKLAQIRNKKGINAFFESPEEFRNKVKNGELKLHRFPFRKGIDNNQPTGIPQGLPISAILANLYLLDFDRTVYDKVCIEQGGYYRRYSDDMVIICKKEQAEEIERFMMEEIKKSLVQISKEKTEKFLFTKRRLGNQPPRLTAIKLTSNSCIIEAPFIYLGFEFFGSKTLIKSANLAKFYRRMIDQVKRKSRLANKIAEREDTKPVVFKRRLYKLYTTANLSKTKIQTRRKRLIQNRFGEYRIQSSKKELEFKSNYLSYARRASTIMEEDAIKKQLYKHRKLFHQALYRHLTRKKLGV